MNKAKLLHLAQRPASYSEMGTGGWCYLKRVQGVGPVGHEVKAKQISTSSMLYSEVGKELCE